MTLGTVGFGRSFPATWTIPIGTLIIVFGLAVFGVISRSVVADFLAWWPVWLGLAVVAVVFRHRKFGVMRAAGLVPLVATLLVVLFIWGHAAGWSLMPSASQRLVGPTADTPVSATLTASIDGSIELGGGSEFLYVVEPAAGGGQFGIPRATEESLDSTIAIELIPTTEPGLYTYAGWDISLANEAAWVLDMSGAVEADLTGLGVEEASFDGSGTIVLGETTNGGTVEVSGQYDLVVPTGVAVSVMGVASVPDSWTLTDGGADSPDGGERWLVVVAEGATVRIIEG